MEVYLQLQIWVEENFAYCLSVSPNLLYHSFFLHLQKMMVVNDTLRVKRGKEKVFLEYEDGVISAACFTFILGSMAIRCD